MRARGSTARVGGMHELVQPLDLGLDYSLHARTRGGLATEYGETQLRIVPQELALANVDLLEAATIGGVGALDLGLRGTTLDEAQQQVELEQRTLDALPHSRWVM